MISMALTVLMVGAGAWSINWALAVWHTFNPYGAKAVMEHYLETGQILGKGTHALEHRDHASSRPIGARHHGVRPYCSERSHTRRT